MVLRNGYLLKAQRLQKRYVTFWLTVLYAWTNYAPLMMPQWKAKQPFEDRAKIIGHVTTFFVEDKVFVVDRPK